MDPLPDDDTLRAWLLPAADDDHFRVEGRHAVRALLESDLEIIAGFDTATESVGVTPRSGRWFREIDPGRLSRLVGFDFHRGVLAIARKPRVSFSDWAKANTVRRLCVLDRLADPGNVGTVIRNAAAFGFDAVICSRAGASPYHAKAVRASATALFRLPVFVEEDWPTTLAAAAPGAVWVGTALVPGAIPLDQFVESAPDSLAVLFGSEADGLPPAILTACGQCLTIPLSDRVESLNVASASAIVLHALRG